MTITVGNLSLTDMPMTYVVGDPKRKQMFFLSGTATTTTEGLWLPTYVTNLSKVDNIFSTNGVQSFSALYAVGTVTGPSAGSAYVNSTTGITITASSFTGAGTITPGTVGPFNINGIITII